MTNETYLNIVTFPRALEFKNNALGIWRRIQMGDLVGKIYLPRSNIGAIDTSFRNLLPPLIKNIDFLIRVEQHMHENSEEFELQWGNYFTWYKKNPEDTAIAAVYRAVIAFPAVQGLGKLSVEDLAKKCIEQFPAWSSRLSDWIEVLTSDDLNAAHPLYAGDHSLWVSAAWIHPKGTGIDYSFINPQLTLHGSNGKNSMDANLWTRAIHAANNNREIPEIWALIRDARAAQRRDLGRRAVLDAGTSAELIIEKNLRRRLLRSNSQPFVDKIMKGTWQVSRRVELMKSLRMWFPQNFEVHLLQLRNNVVHKNARVTTSEAKHAVDAAEQLARKYESGLLK